MDGFTVVAIALTVTLGVFLGVVGPFVPGCGVVTAAGVAAGVPLGAGVGAPPPSPPSVGFTVGSSAPGNAGGPAAFLAA